MEEFNWFELFRIYRAEVLALAAISLAMMQLIKKIFPKITANYGVYLPFGLGVLLFSLYAFIFASSENPVSNGFSVGGCTLLLKTLFGQLVKGSITVSLPAENKLMTVTGILTGITDLETAKILAENILKKLENTSSTQDAVALCHEILKEANLSHSEKELLNISCIILGALSFIKL